MNKDVIYIEPEDDITDIITKIEKSKSKIVALVPPKKAGVFRSIVNIKLIAKSSKSAEKSVVLVTSDPSIVKLAAATHLPVAKNLQSAPAVPKAENAPAAEVSSTEDIELEDEIDEEATEEVTEAVEENDTPSPDKADSSEDTADDKPTPKSRKKSANKFIAWITDHKKLAIFTGIACVGLICFLVWAFAIAPAATITIGIKATSNNFSEGVSFVSTLADEKASEGKFYLEEKKVEDTKTVEFTATGKKNVGEKATGDVTVIATISSDGGTVQVKAGDTFTNGGLTFIADKGVTMSFDGKDTSVCDNVNDDTTIKEFSAQGCKIYAKISVTAAEPGAKYNISARDTGWDSVAPVAAYSTNAMSGGTNQELTVVQQSDIDKAKESLTESNAAENKTKLFESITDDMLVIDSSYKQATADAVSTPAVGEEVKDGNKATLKAVTTASVYVVDKTKVEEFIAEKANLSDDQKIYAMNNPFIENFMQTSDGYTGKLKTSYLTGPTITVTSVVDLVKGKGFGDAQHALKDINGVTDVKIQGSFPWVTSVPSDSNKITVDIEVKDQNGETVKANVEEDQSDKSQNDKSGKESDNNS